MVKNSPANAEDTRDMGSLLGSGRSPGEGKGNPLQYAYLGNPMDREAWKSTVHEVSKRIRHNLVTKQQAPHEVGAVITPFHRRGY